MASQPIRLLIAALALALAWIPMASAESPGKEGADVSAAPPLYQLPKVGKPTGRVGGGRRGGASALPDVYALVPDHVGFSASSQPVLYWYMSDKAKGEVLFELTLIDEKSVDPLVDRRFTAPPKPGLQRVDLTTLGVRLEPGEEYQWSISLVPDPKDRSKDLVATGWIEVVSPPDGMADRLAAAGPGGAAAVYGEAGLWYDTLDATLSQADRGDTQAQGQLALLLKQVGLPEEAASH
ncbi:MAG: DUF928 domain-containing protein [Myxococcota bacterium]